MRTILWRIVGLCAHLFFIGVLVMLVRAGFHVAAAFFSVLFALHAAGIVFDALKARR